MTTEDPLRLERDRLKVEVERLRAENARLKGHPEGFSAETMQAMADEVKRLRQAAYEASHTSIRAVVEERDNLRVKLAKAVAALERLRFLPVRKGGSVAVNDIACQTLKEIGE